MQNIKKNGALTKKSVPMILTAFLYSSECTNTRCRRGAGIPKPARRADSPSSFTTGFMLIFSSVATIRITSILDPVKRCIKLFDNIKNVIKFYCIYCSKWLD